MLSIEQKIQHLVGLGFSGDMTQVKNFYAGKVFDPKDRNMQQLVRYSTKLWQEYSQILRSLARATNEDEKAKLLTHKEKLISIAFPEHGTFGNFCDNFYCTVGAVDFDKENIAGFNQNVQFGPYTLAVLGNYALVGEDVKIGATFGQDIQPNQKVILGNDVWVCASTVIGAGATVTDGSVLALGACLYPHQRTDVNALAVGNPCTTKLIIDDNYQSTKDNLTYRSAEEVRYIVNHVRSLGLEVDDAFINALNGKKYNCFAGRMAQITNFSHELSYEFNHSATTGERRHEIIDILFPLKGEDFTIGRGLFVDVLGLAKVGNHVSIGDNAFFAGNAIIGNNVRAGSNLVLAGIGHELPASKRRLRVYDDVFGEVCEVGKIQIGNNVTIGDHCTLAPGSVLTGHLSNHCYVVGQNKIFHKPNAEQIIGNEGVTC